MECRWALIAAARADAFGQMRGLCGIDCGERTSDAIIGWTLGVFSSHEDSAAVPGFSLFSLPAAQISLSQFLYLSICPLTPYIVYTYK
jgi:hypothetical protein